VYIRRYNNSHCAISCYAGKFLGRIACTLCVDAANIVTDVNVAYVGWSCVCVCVGHTGELSKTAEPIDTLFQGQPSVWPKESCIVWDLSSRAEK